MKNFFSPVVFYCVLSLTGNAGAAVSNFNPNQNNDWFEPLNWSGGVPNAIDTWAGIQSGTANINAAATAGGASSANNLSVASGATLNILSSGSLTVTNNGYSGGNTRILGTMNAAGDFNAGASLNVGRDTFGSLLSISAGTTLVESMTIAQTGSNNVNTSSGKVEISGSGKMEISGNINLGNGGSNETGSIVSELNILSGATGGVSFGVNNTNNRTLAVGGAARTTAIINIQAGSLTGGNGARIQIANNATATGTITQSGGTVTVNGTSNAVAGQLQMNLDGVANYNLSGGTLLVRDILLGGTNGTKDTFTVSGTAATLTVEKNFTMDADGVYRAQIGLDGVTAMTVGDTISLNGELELSLSAFSDSFNQDVLLITSNKSVSGNFNGLNEGAAVFAAYNPGVGYWFDISYNNNDVLLKFNHAVPEPSAIAFLILGLAVLAFARRR